uniref:Glycosyltransferase n=1 Tax=viral metagenome TaxID=1070528 RepID=A0A6C0LGB4_9ZZZZ
MKILVTVLSCKKHEHLWEKITSKDIENLIIFIGGSDETYYDKKTKILHLKCNDKYDGLPEKMILMMEYILHSIHFSDVTHIIKIDDHDNVFTKENIDHLYNINELQEYHYIGQKLNNTTSFPWTWHDGNTYHYGKVESNTYWHDRCYSGGYLPWLDGGCSYILSKEAIKCIFSWYNSSNLEELRESEIFEDLMMGKILYHHDIFPKLVNYNIIGDKQ